MSPVAARHLVHMIVFSGLALGGCTTDVQEPVHAIEPPSSVQSLDANDPSVQAESPALSLAAESNHDAPTEGARFATLRKQMVRGQLRARDITDADVLEAMGSVPRHQFVPERMRPLAYSDQPLPIGHGQTISQPYIVALMTQLVRPSPKARVLDVGTGSGYQAAVLAELVEDVYSIEIVKPLADAARDRLESLGYGNIHVRSGDGYRGWPEHAPFDAIVVAAAPEQIPPPLIEQLAPGGRLVIPVGDFFQKLMLVERQSDGSVRKKTITAVAFVPMTGEALDQ